jgi:predicted nucleic acid-binding protein
VLQEFYVVTTRKFQPPLSRAIAREIVALYSTWTIVAVDVALILDAAILEEAAQLSFWDALIVEAARRAGAARLVSEDLGAGQVFGETTIVNPFVAAGGGAGPR